MTGLYPHVNGHRTLWHLLRPHEPNLLSYLRQAGYSIQWYGKNDLFSKDLYTSVVDELGANGGGHGGENIYDISDPRYYTFLKGAEESDLASLKDAQNVQKAVEFLRSHRKGDKPFFLFLPLSMPHPPYSAPKPFHDMYGPKDVPPLRPRVRERKPSYFPLIERYRNLGDLDESALKQINAVYLGMNSCMDQLLGQLLDALDETGHRQDTTVIVSSDHGDYAGDYGLVEKWPNAFEDPLVRVPLILRSPDSLRGHRVREQVELFDIMPTVLELSGVQCRHTHFARSLRPQLEGGRGDPSRRVYAEGGYNTNEPHCFEGFPGRAVPGNPKIGPGHNYYPKLLQQQEEPKSVCRTTMVRSSELKLIYREHDQSELYDLIKDPLELTNLFGRPEYAEQQSALMLDLLRWLQATSDTVPFDEDGRGFKEGKL